MKWIAGLLGWLWRLSRASWIDVGNGLRPHSAASALYIFLFLIFAIVAVVLLLLGIDLGDADRWIDAQASWLDTIGSIALRIVFALILLACATAIVMGLYQRLPGRRTRPRAHARKGQDPSEDPPNGGRVGVGAMIVALIVAYFAAIGAFGHY